MRPQMVGPIDPGGLHAGVERAQRVERGVVAHVQHILGRQVQRAGGGVEDARIGLADAELARGDRGAEKRAEAHALQVGIAIGHAHQREARRQELQRRAARRRTSVTRWRSAKKTSKACSASNGFSPAR